MDVGRRRIKPMGQPPTLNDLGSVHPDSETWTFSGTDDTRVRRLCRRLAVEVAIHLFDIERAAAVEDGPSLTPVNGDVAAAGIEGFIVELLPSLLSRTGFGSFSGHTPPPRHGSAGGGNWASGPAGRWLFGQ